MNKVLVIGDRGPVVVGAFYLEQAVSRYEERSGATYNQITAAIDVSHISELKEGPVPEGIVATLLFKGDDHGLKETIKLIE